MAFFFRVGEEVTSNKMIFRPKHTAVYLKTSPCQVMSTFLLHSASSLSPYALNGTAQWQRAAAKEDGKSLGIMRKKKQGIESIIPQPAAAWHGSCPESGKMFQ